VAAGPGQSLLAITRVVHPLLVVLQVIKFTVSRS
jgi:hypothetical protein